MSVIKNRPSKNISINLPEDLKKQVRRLPDQNKFIIHALKTAFEKYKTDLNQWHTKEIQKGIKEADAEDFASEKEVDAFFSKWIKNAN